jgi:hypothetical protein
MICDDELSELSEHTYAAFRQDLLIYLRRNLSPETRGLDDAALMERIIESERRALDHGVADSAAIAWFACTAFGSGPTAERMFDTSGMDSFQPCEVASTLLLSPEEADEILASALGE